MVGADERDHPCRARERVLELADRPDADAIKLSRRGDGDTRYRDADSLDAHSGARDAHAVTRIRDADADADAATDTESGTNRGGHLIGHHI